MSNDAFSVDTDGLSKNMPYIRNLAERLSGIGKSLEATVGALGPCWGDDETGAAFFNQYNAPSLQIFEGVNGSSDVVNSTADGITTMASNFERLEDENTAGAAQLTARTGTLSARTEAVPATPAVPETKATPRLLLADSSSKMTDRIPAEPAIPGTPGIPATPRLLTAQTGELSARTEALPLLSAATPGSPLIPATPGIPGETFTGISTPRIPAEPATYDGAFTPGTPIEPLTPMTPRLAAEPLTPSVPATPRLMAEHVSPMTPRMDSEPGTLGTPATPLLPAHHLLAAQPAEMTARIPAEPLTPVTPSVPATPRLTAEHIQEPAARVESRPNQA